MLVLTHIDEGFLSNTPKTLRKGKIYVQCN